MTLLSESKNLTRYQTRVIIIVQSLTVKKFLILSMALAACTSTTTTIPPVSAAPTTVTTSTSSTTTLPPTTATTIDSRPISPLDGLPVDDETLVDRRVIGVKIDNHWDARPQSGINKADAVFEIPVEANLTRFIAVFHDSDADYLGPMRSGRPTDPTVLAPLDATFIISGAQPWVQNVFRNYGVPFIGEVRPATFRISQRHAPHNLYVDTELLRETADARDISNAPPEPMFVFGENTSDDVATEISFDWSSDTKITWNWTDGAYERSTGGSTQNWIDADWETMGPITAQTLVVIFARRYTASGSSGSSVPAMDTVGEGRTVVFANGTVFEGTWSREDVDEPFDLVDETGDALVVPPGKPWISIFPDTRTLSW